MGRGAEQPARGGGRPAGYDAARVFQSLLTRRYLLSKVMPLLASAAVMLCVAMVITVWSVMGGFLNMLLSSGKSMIGDVSITWPVQGIPRYERLIEMLEADPMVDAASPIIECPGLITLPSTDSKPVSVLGVDPAGYDRVTGFYERLWWQPLEEPLPKDRERQDPRLTMPADMQAWREHGTTLREPSNEPGGESDPASGAPAPALKPAVALGIEMMRWNNRRTDAGFYDPRYYFMPTQEVTLSVPPLSERGVVIEMATRRFPVANEFRTGLFDADANWVILPIDELQRLLRMDAARRVRPGSASTIVIGPDGSESFAAPEIVEDVPARATTILVKATKGVPAETLHERCVALYASFAGEQASLGLRVPPADRIPIFTWDNKPGLSTFIAAVRKETSLVLTLFAFISMTSVFLVFAIFWAMISEKTKDIGVLRALGAGRLGIAWLFLRYGAAIGVVGSLCGAALAVTIVTYINPIHEWLGSALGIVVWDPAVYVFFRIPNEVEAWKVAAVMGSGILSSVLGALIPAVRAAWMDPVRALRFE